MSPAKKAESNFQRQTIEFQRRLIAQTVDLHDGNISEAAQDLGIERTNMYRLMRRLGLQLETKTRLAVVVPRPPAV